MCLPFFGKSFYNVKQLTTPYENLKMCFQLTYLYELHAIHILHNVKYFQIDKYHLVN